MTRRHECARNISVTSKLIASALVGLVVLFSSGVAPATDPMPSAAFQLSPGVVIDLSDGSAYILDTDDRVAALDISSGAERWKAKEHGRPVGLANSLLVTQSSGDSDNSNLHLFLLDARDGTVSKKTEAPLPTNVRASSETSFVLKINRWNAAPAITWQSAQRHLGGARPGGSDAYLGKDARLTTSPAPHGVIRPTNGADAEIRSDAYGAFALDLSSGNAIPLPMNSAKKLISEGNQRHANGDPNSLPSVDGSYYVVSKLIDSSSAEESYEWTVFSSLDNRPIGIVKTSARVYPYFVYGDRLVYDRPEISRMVAGSIVTSPRALVSFDLKASRLVWSRAIKDENRRGPTPP